ncbi:hypothetical protein [Pseudotamlana agarivorans]|uniref:hypothetical protein n=1 Tax=Pseudotamlana agarivorans TaxID=481183 RepID=UPI000835018D|nr:hypothetical protein [Tamlana agarivorans]
MAGLKPLFNRSQVQGIVDQFKIDTNNKFILALKYMGEEFVSEARLKGNYKDKSGNLRSSIGYIILDHGEVVESVFNGKNKIGRDKGEAFATEVASSYHTDLVLIGVAAMSYAAYVEAKNYDVISSAAAITRKSDLLAFVFKDF